MPAPAVTQRPTSAEVGYVLAVALTAGLGLITGSPAAVVVAALATLPISLVALPAYYLVYGLLALVPGANPSAAAGSETCRPAGECVRSGTGGPADWFTLATDVAGVTLLTAGAAVNLLLWRAWGVRDR